MLFGLPVLEFVNSPASDTMPDIFVTVNFMTLGIAPLSSSTGGSRLKSVGILVVFTNNTDDALGVSPPTLLFLGMHLFGRIAMGFRSVFTNLFLSSFETFSVRVP